MDALNKNDDIFLKYIAKIKDLRNFKEDPASFWNAYLETIVRISEAFVGIIAVNNGDNNDSWRCIGLYPGGNLSQAHSKLIIDSLTEMVSDCVSDGTALKDTESGQILSVCVNTGSDNGTCLAAVLIKDGISPQDIEKIRYLQLISDVPQSYQLQRVADESKVRVEQFASVLDLMVLINAENRFLSAAMTFCNELASRHKCERVSIGWLENGYVRIKAVSRSDDFDKKTEAIQKLEAVMEEALDQDSEIVLSEKNENSMVDREHKTFMRTYDIANICSFPLRIDDEPVAVCTIERSSIYFGNNELRLLRLSCDQAIRRLDDLKHNDRWFGARMMSDLRTKLTGFLGFEHTWAKTAAIFAALLLGILCFGRVTHRVETPAILRTDDISYLTAPFDGHISDVDVRVGDSVKKGEPILSLDSADLILEEASISAEKNRYERELEKARASGALADMKIAKALRDQASARLDLVRHKLKQASVTAPYDGVIIEGDLIERIGSPVKQGDVLFKIGNVGGLYTELEVNELDIHHVKDSLNGEIALASRPQDTVFVDIKNIEPVAVSREKGNVFIVKCDFPEGYPDWWRPGMTGIAKLNAGKRTLLWILTHRTVDFLRLKFWW